MTRARSALFAVVALAVVALAAPVALAQRAPLVQPFVSVDAPLVALRHARVIDGTGAPPREDQTIVVRDGRIAAVGAKIAVPAGARVLDLTGKTVIPGLVGMHEHLFWPAKMVPGFTMFDESFFVPQPYSFPRLYLAAGVTTARTAGSIAPYTDLAVKRQIDRGLAPGPRLDVTGPYIEGAHPRFVQFAPQADAAGVTRLVDYWAQEGVTSFKVYNFVTRAQLDAAIAAAHRRGLKVAGHLCSIGYREAAAAGIDSLEHGLLADSEFVPGKVPDLCPSTALFSVNALDIKSEPVQAMIKDLVAHHVTVDSTLAVFDAALGGEIDPRGLPLAVAEAQKSVAALPAFQSQMGKMLPGIMQRELAFERAFVDAGGLLLSGCDPTGDGTVLAGFGDQRNLELLVTGGFSPVEAIHVATQNGATYLGRADIGSIAAGKRADLVVLDGNPARDIHDIEKVVTVFKDGVGYDSKKLIDAVRGNVGLR
ncbi:MAG TPA: amidohydrolase family protein [Polyangia bacterium]|jgi:imidazolonepropionase-like amidohydrolase